MYALRYCPPPSTHPTTRQSSLHHLPPPPRPLPQTAHNLMRLIAEGSGEDDEEADAELRRGAVVTFMELLPRADLPDVLLLVCVCVCVCVCE